MLKDIVVNLTVGEPRDAAADYAISLAKAFDAHLAAVAFAYEPVLPAIMGADIPESVIEEQREDNEKAAKIAAARFETASATAGISHELRIVTGSLAGAADTFGEIARRFDLAVVGQSERDRVTPEELIVEGALFGSGRPVVVVPHAQKAGFRLDRVVVCWNGGRTAARAVADAMPFLHQAKAVEVVTIGTDAAKNGEASGADIGQHLTRHGLRVEVKTVPPGNLKVSAAILSYAATSAADLLVMGGYGHSRLREFILGGTTRGILKTTTVPTLMSH
jgi:nucleotide-binding universal stress UspA family protein